MIFDQVLSTSSIKHLVAHQVKRIVDSINVLVGSEVHFFYLLFAYKIITKIDLDIILENKLFKIISVKILLHKSRIILTQATQNNNFFF